MADHKASAAGGPALQVRNGVLTVEVANVAQTQAAAGRLARALQGRVERSGNSVMAGEKPTAEVVIKVPVARFDRAIEQVRALGRVVTESTKDDDVTVHVADSEARLRALRSEEAQYQTIMKGTKKVEEVLKVKSRMSQVRQQIEGLDAQRKVLREQALMSTITIHLSQKPAPSAPTKSGGLIASDWESASSGLSAVGRAAAGAGVYVLVFSPVWIPIGGLGYFLWRKTAARFA